jgi:exoribonuclease R
VIVHRLLDAAISSTSQNHGEYQIGEGRSIADDLASVNVPAMAKYTTEMVKEIGETCNTRKNNSKAAQDASQHLFLCTFLALEYERLGGLPDGSDFAGYETAIVHKVQERSFDVLIPKYGVEKRCWVEDIVDRGLADGCVFNETKGSLVVHWKDTNANQEICVFDQIPVCVFCCKLIGED